MEEKLKLQAFLPLFLYKWSEDRNTSEKTKKLNKQNANKDADAVDANISDRRTAPCHERLVIFIQSGESNTQKSG